MIQKLLNNIEAAKTPFHVVKRAQEILQENGFLCIEERDSWKILRDGKYFCTRNGSSLIAFTVGKDFAFNIVAAHSDSPCLKLKGNPDTLSAGLNKLNTEVYGGPILNTWLDRKLVIAGRALYADKNGIRQELIQSPYNIVIPNVAVHLNRDINNGYKLNPQIDLCPITGIGKGDIKQLTGDCLGYDLFVVCAEKGYTFGKDNELFSSPRLDDLEGVFGALEAFAPSNGQNINVLALFDNEEVGSATKQGAGSTFLTDVLARIAFALGKNQDEIRQAYAKSMVVSLDCAHANHPNHPELSDPTTQTLMGGGIAIKHHAHYYYITDGLSEAYFKGLLSSSGVKYQDFYVKSDIKSGATLGAINSTRLSVPAVDIGLPQLAMHSAMETACISDYKELIKGLSAFYNSFKI